MAKDNGHFEIIFYILAAVVGLAVNAYRNYTKRKQGQMQKGPEDVEFPETIFDEEENIPEEEPEVLFDEIESIPEPEPVTGPQQETPAAKMEPVGTEGYAVFEHTSEELISDNTDPQATVEQKGYVSIREQKILLEEQEDEDSSELDFDLEQAVIFSEILKPKYFDNGY